MNSRYVSDLGLSDVTNRAAKRDEEVVTTYSHRQVTFPGTKLHQNRYGLYWFPSIDRGCRPPSDRLARVTSVRRSTHAVLDTGATRGNSYSPEAAPTFGLVDSPCSRGCLARARAPREAASADSDDTETRPSDCTRTLSSSACPVVILDGPSPNDQTCPVGLSRPLANVYTPHTLTTKDTPIVDTSDGGSGTTAATVVDNNRGLLSFDWYRYHVVEERSFAPDRGKRQSGKGW
ncbi:hypothetical protein FIBSPDRAFT_886455 [Athelia psychrophila]|uniref:Uncharacterized protein n=1 Tax=Athelia psychrophila TaxID=1759441 RepID=A0A166QUU8_9AGAM|nr:hypothetical protein FIBSPDRAFT_886455 [Fibularhizoctonia sp. CBS 109695]